MLLLCVLVCDHKFLSVSVSLHHVCFRVWNMFCRVCLPHTLVSVCFTVEFSCFDHPPFSITSEPAGPSPTQMDRFPSVSPLHACHQFFRSVILQSLCRLTPFTDEDTLRLAGRLQYFGSARASAKPTWGARVRGGNVAVLS